MVRGTTPRRPSKFGRQAGVPATRAITRGGVEAGAKAVRGGAKPNSLKPVKAVAGKPAREAATEAEAKDCGEARGRHRESGETRGGL